MAARPLRVDLNKNLTKPFPNVDALSVEDEPPLYCRNHGQVCVVSRCSSWFHSSKVLTTRLDKFTGAVTAGEPMLVMGKFVLLNKFSNRLL